MARKLASRQQNNHKQCLRLYHTCTSGSLIPGVQVGLRNYLTPLGGINDCFFRDIFYEVLIHIDAFYPPLFDICDNMANRIPLSQIILYRNGSKHHCLLPLLILT